MMRVHAPRVEPEWRTLQGQVPRLVRLLRTARFSLLYGPEGAGKTTLLHTEVMPLLGRRAGDAPHAPSSPPRVVVPFVERRGRSTGLLGDPGPEVAVCFDAWGPAPLEALRRGIDAAASWLEPGVMQASQPGLAAPLAIAGRRHGARFLIVLDGFERHLAQAPGEAGVTQFDDALVEAVTRPFLPVHFLLAMREDAEPWLAKYRLRIPRLDDHFVRLDGATAAAPAISPFLWRGAGPTMVPPSAPAAEPRQAETSTSNAFADTVWLESLDTLVVKVAEAGRDEGQPIAGAAAAAARAPEPAAPETRRAPVPPQVPGAAGPESAMAKSPAGASRGRHRSTGLWAVGALLAAAALALLAWPPGPKGVAPEAAAPSAVATAPARPRALQPSPAPVAATPRPPLPVTPAALPFDLAFDANPADARIARDLAEFVAPWAGLSIDPMPSTRWAQGLLAADDAPGASIARYDALQAARRQPGMAALRIVAPLVVEPVGFVVRDDSPLRFIHELKGHAINVGAPDSARALTASTIYERLFGVRVPASAGRALDQEAALQQLRSGGALEVVASFGTEPAAESGLRLLKLDPDQAASRRALQAYLPATMGTTPTLGVMSFLVAPEPRGSEARLRLAHVAEALCRALPILQRNGDPRWQRVRPGLDFDAGWPALPEAQAAWRACSTTPR